MTLTKQKLIEQYKFKINQRKTAIARIENLETLQEAVNAMYKDIVRFEGEIKRLESELQE